MASARAKGNILVVDDEPQITRVLKTTLSAQGYGVRTAGDGDEALSVMSDWSPDLLITDLRMPNMNGLELCRHVRAKSRIPIMVLSVKGEELTKVEALDAGADDYVTKPFSVDELLARLRAALRRAEPSPEPVLSIGELRIDLEARDITFDGKTVQLTPHEYSLLTLLARNEGKLLTHQAILREVWGRAYADESHYLHVYVSQLRRKLEPDPARPRYVLTEPGVGYRLVDPQRRP